MATSSQSGLGAVLTMPNLKTPIQIGKILSENDTEGILGEVVAEGSLGLLEAIIQQEGPASFIQVLVEGGFDCIASTTVSTKNNTFTGCQPERALAISLGQKVVMCALGQSMWPFLPVGILISLFFYVTAKDKMALDKMRHEIEASIQAKYNRIRDDMAAKMWERCEKENATTWQSQTIHDKEEETIIRVDHNGKRYEVTFAAVMRTWCFLGQTPYASGLLVKPLSKQDAAKIYITYHSTIDAAHKRPYGNAMDGVDSSSAKGIEKMWRNATSGKTGLVPNSSVKRILIQHVPVFEEPNTMSSVGKGAK